MCSSIKRVRSGTLAPALQTRECWPPATTRAKSHHSEPEGKPCPVMGWWAWPAEGEALPGSRGRGFHRLCYIVSLVPGQNTQKSAADGKVVTCAAGVEDASGAGAGRGHESPETQRALHTPGAALSPGPPSAHGSTACVAWEPAGDGKRVISLADNHILLWDLQEGSSQAVLAGSASLEGKGQLKFTTGRWSPHHNCTQAATANDTAVRGWDTRTMSQIYCIESAHGQLVRDLDFNPNKQYYLASCGDDCRVKFWDTRNVTEPVKTLEEHSHWVWSVRYNHSHDQLVLTGSSDGRVVLSNMASISSEPFGHLVDDDDLSDQEERRPEEKSQEPPQDSVIATYEEHEDSVYAVDWSSADPWLFASLSYDGRLVINRVPRALKYHILL
ncbi:EARP and GARP complex-interacting protein 1 isoform X2 [Balaenoptera musculus]|uniref:EARP and GARP complex-interacting protein 1 n=1 Tax=Balaenoptera musculus TaxID=9771 RepID=A0A8B8Z9Z6_BALMU|nr:EARP and GARP complex-interacting protein 1 isoform X2 [Balaenoptera musculus]